MGKKAEAKVFYEFQDEAGPTWVEYARPSLPGPKKTKFEGVAVQIYKVPDTKPNFANVIEYKCEYLVIQSPYLRKELESALDKHGIVFKDEKAEVDWPFCALYFERHHIQEVSEQHETLECREHFQLLCKAINDEIGGIIDEAEELSRERKITYDTLWTLFPPASLVITPATPYHQGYRVQKIPKYIISTTNIPENDRLVITLQHLVFDGLQYGTVTFEREIGRFSGKKDITELDIFPYSYVAEPEDLRNEMMQRGKKVLHFQSHHYMEHAVRENSEAQSSNADVVKNFWRGEVRIRVRSPTMGLTFEFNRRMEKSSLTPMHIYVTLNALLHTDMIGMTERTRDLKSIHFLAIT